MFIDEFAFQTIASLCSGFELLLTYFIALTIPRPQNFLIICKKKEKLRKNPQAHNVKANRIFFAFNFIFTVMTFHFSWPGCSLSLTFYQLNAVFPFCFAAFFAGGIGSSIRRRFRN